ncbi:MAG TPA: hypothetical protein VK638_10290 [Edaphobacter sp.]|nr:hypothetical protein [Edaphobacter sp.]
MAVVVRFPRILLGEIDGRLYLASTIKPDRYSPAEIKAVCAREELIHPITVRPNSDGYQMSFIVLRWVRLLFCQLCGVDLCRLFDMAVLCIAVRFLLPRAFPTPDQTTHI